MSVDPSALVARLAVACAASGSTVAVAESCTGGSVAARITDQAGVSNFFLGGIVSYANEVKEALLGVPRETLAAHGAVSEPTARAMAEGVRRATGATLGVSITGVAGPDGGTPEKPVGLVYLGISGPRGTAAHREVWSGSRAAIRAAAVARALELLVEAAEASA